MLLCEQGKYSVLLFIMYIFHTIDFFSYLDTSTIIWEISNEKVFKT